MGEEKELAVLGFAETANGGLTVIFEGGVPKTVPANHVNFSEISDKLADNDHDGLMELIEPYETMLKEEMGDLSESQASRIAIRYGEAYYDDTRLDNAMGRHLVSQMSRKRPMKSFLNFVHKTMQNPSYAAIQELYQFLDTWDHLPLTPSGNFIAYKKVRSDFKDIYTGTMDNSPGQIVKMDRSEVDPNRRRTCSYGLHFCSYSYLNCYGGDHNTTVIAVEINPADVVAIPADYNNTKGRTCKYKSLYEVTDWNKIDSLNSKEYAAEDYLGNSSEDDDYDYEDDYEDEDYDYEDFEI